MPHETALIAILAGGLGLAFVFGLAAQRLSLPPLVGYMLAGIAIGPFTPGFVGDAGLASQLAEVGVILLMFGVGLHFSPADLLAVRGIAIPGAVVQILAAPASARWSPTSGDGDGRRASSSASRSRWRAPWSCCGPWRTAAPSTPRTGASPWAGSSSRISSRSSCWCCCRHSPRRAERAGAGLLAAIGWTLAKVLAFLAFMLVVGRRAVPWLLERVARTGSRELFTLAVLAIALGIAVGAASLFGVSFALGAFFAGVVISESDLSHKAAADALPLQDAFAVLFFVSVGMLFDPSILLRQPLQVVAVVLIILVGKSLAAFFIVLAFRYPLRTALTISASLAQIGEFSFILGALGISLGLLPPEARSLVVAGALLSITLNPVMFRLVAPLERWVQARPALARLANRTAGAALPGLAGAARGRRLRGHAVLVGHGRVGSRVAAALSERAIPYVVIENDRESAAALGASGVAVLYGDAARPGLLEHAGLAHARLLLVTTPDPFEARAVIELARRIHPAIDIAVRTHSDAEREHLEGLEVGRAVMGERELADAMSRYALERFGEVAS